MAAYTNPAWWADKSDDFTIIRGSDGDSICAMRRRTGDRLPKEQDANAALITLAPELFKSVCDLVSAMRKSDVEANPHGDCNSEEWDAALDDAQALIDLLAEDGVTLGKTAGEGHGA